MSKTVVLSADGIDKTKFCPRCVGYREWKIKGKYRKCKTCGLKVQAS